MLHRPQHPGLQLQQQKKENTLPGSNNIHIVQMSGRWQSRLQRQQQRVGLQHSLERVAHWYLSQQ